MNPVIKDSAVPSVDMIWPDADAVRVWTCRGRAILPAERPLIMGIVNVTPDSFSDGGRYANSDRAVAHGLKMLEQGADIIDVGGESTRPGAAAVDAAEEARRVIPVIRELRRHVTVPVSVDTMKAAVARQALEAGADIINDVSALTHDPDMPALARETKAGVVLMHMQGTPRTMQNYPEYADVMGDVVDFLEARVRDLAQVGLDPAAMAVDPGIGFGKTLEHNLALLAHVDRFHRLGRPVVIGLSRKSFLGTLTGRDADDRLAGSLAALAVCAWQGAEILRVHDVQESADAVRVVAALRRSGNGVE